MEQTSETHVVEEQTEKIDNKSDSVIESKNEDSTDSVDKQEVVTLDEENKVVEEQDIQNNLEVEDTHSTSTIEESNEIQNVVIEKTNVHLLKDDELEKLVSPNEVDNNESKKKGNNEDIVEVEKKKIEDDKVELVEKPVETSIKDVVELVDDVNYDEDDSTLPEKEVSSEEPETDEGTNIHLSSPITPETNVAGVESLEKKIENINIISKKENVLTEEKQNSKEKSIETKKIKESDEKENANYLENPTNPTSSYLNKIFTPAEDAPTPKNRLSEYVEEEISQDTKPKNFPLKVVMNPKGKVRDLTSLPNEEFFTDTGLLSPDKCKELISGLNEPKGKGAELFAKRRKRAEKWAAENEVQENQQNLPYNQKKEPFYQDRVSEAKRATREIYQQQKQEQFYNPPLKENDYYSYAPNQFNQSKESQTSYQPNKPLNQRELAYKPSVAQGWKSSPIFLPTDLYVPKEISLDSYIAPPNTDNFIPKPHLERHVSFGTKNPWTQANGKSIQPSYFKVSSEPVSSPWHEMEKQAPKSYSQPNWIKIQSQPKQFSTYNPALTHSEILEPQTQYPPPQRTYQFRSNQPMNSLPSSYNQNFNTAARGWNGSKMGNCYKPITFGNQTRNSDCMQYTDF